ncbi:MAG: flavin reductase family protein [Nitratireductor sp.]|nr:flavin reductase family protein [Nitratireductor sp.]
MNEAEGFRDGMRRLAAAVNIIATMSDGKPCGMIATAVCSVSADPPMLLACINRSATSFAEINDARCFSVNVLRESQYPLVKKFFESERTKRFDHFEWAKMKTGAPAIEDALVSFDCQIEQSIEAGSHAVFIGRVVDVRTCEVNNPLLYFNGNYAVLRNLPSDAVPMGAG